MPVYEYRCQECAHLFSHYFRTLRLAEEESAPPCPACGAHQVQRLISRMAVVGGREARAGAAAEKDVTPSQAPLFGRKELHQALKERGY